MANLTGQRSQKRCLICELWPLLTFLNNWQLGKWYLCYAHLFHTVSGLKWLVRYGSMPMDDNSIASFWQSLLENRGCNNAIKGRVMKYTSCFYLLVIFLFVDQQSCNQKPLHQGFCPVNVQKVITSGLWGEITKASQSRRSEPGFFNPCSWDTYKS